ncbi:hypothetical protein GOP47_0002668 [Adiantum capillus-veneris]|uniref:Uncharacterized protein n=1 Tax=Adiantum capillus-veneris TaxID=13818 RepID=A0A9D4VBD4_ADICA|nr:hypothetical protein GOP47_0002668 [Adiantum capillus-veneris]
MPTLATSSYGHSGRAPAHLHLRDHQLARLSSKRHTRGLYIWLSNEILWYTSNFSCIGEGWSEIGMKSVAHIHDVMGWSKRVAAHLFL